MRKVLAIIHTPTFGGPHNQIRRLYHPLREAGWEYVVLLPDEPGDGAEKLRSLGIQVHILPLHRLRAVKSLRFQLHYLKQFPKDIRRIQTVAQEEKADLIQVCGFQHPQGAIAAKRLQLPLVWQILSTFAPRPLRILLSPLVRRLAHVVMSTGRRVAEAHPGIGTLGERLVLFYPPIDLEELRSFRSYRGWARKFLDVKEETVVLGTLGNRNRQKAHEVFVEAAALLKEWGVPCQVRIVGRTTAGLEDWYQKNVIEYAKMRGGYQKGFLKLLESPPEGPRVLAGFDVFVLSSHAEGIPTSAMEAMALGKPVVATDVGSVREIIQDGKQGILVPPRNPQRLAQALRELVENPERRHRMGEAAYHRAMQEFHLERCVKAHLEAFEKAIQWAYDRH